MSETSGDVPSAAQVIHLEDANAPEDADRRYVTAKIGARCPQVDLGALRVWKITEHQAANCFSVNLMIGRPAGDFGHGQIRNGHDSRKPLCFHLTWAQLR